MRYRTQIDPERRLVVREEEGVAPDSRTETYAALRLQVSNWRWAGVPFYLRTGKRLARKAVISSVNVPLDDVPLRQVLGERLGVPVFVDDDATIAALAEAHDHKLRMVAANLVMITIGTGIGGGLLLGGRIAVFTASTLRNAGG